jgi:hypothetical protein
LETVGEARWWWWWWWWWSVQAQSTFNNEEALMQRRLLRTKRIVINDISLTQQMMTKWQQMNNFDEYMVKIEANNENEEQYKEFWFRLG